MIGYFIILLIAIVLGGLVGTLIVRDPGYVLVSYETYVLETSLWVALIILVLAYVAIRLTALLLKGGLRTSVGLSNWRVGRRTNAARSKTLRGLLLLTEGQYMEAKKLLLAGADQVDLPIVNQLLAAQAAHKLEQHAESDKLLTQVRHTVPGAKFAVALMDIEFLINQNRYQEAIEALLPLQQRAPKHRLVLAHLCECYAAIRNYALLLPTLDQAIKANAITSEQFQHLQRIAWANEVHHQEIHAILKRLPPNLREDEQFILDWCTQGENQSNKDAHLLPQAEGQDQLQDQLQGEVQDEMQEQLPENTQKQKDDCLEILRWSLEAKYQPQLLLRYTSILGSSPKSQLKQMETWRKGKFKRFADLAEFNLGLGRVCLMVKEFDRAREYFEASLKSKPSYEVYAELGRLYSALGDEHRGREFLLRAAQYVSDLPQPGQ